MSPHHTRYLSAQDAAQVVSRLGLSATLHGMAAYIEADFRRWPEFDKSARVASHSADGVIELMPISDHQTYTFKYVNGHPRNVRYGLSTVMAFGVLADVATGMPELISELTLTTALRTAAMSAVAARVLARPGSRVMALIGNGAQAEFQAMAFAHLLRIDTLRLFDVDEGATRKLMRNLAGSGLNLVACRSAGEAVQGADIVTTATADKTNAVILSADMLAPGMHINALGGDCPGKTELACEVLQGSRVFVEYEPQSRVEGDIQQMPAQFPVTELWRVLTGHARGRTHDQEITVFDSVGFALEDFAALRFMRDAAERLGMLRTLDLIPQMADPKNLFGLLAGAVNVPLAVYPRAAPQPAVAPT
jgi:ornithine cyclodeaminase